MGIVFYNGGACLPRPVLYTTGSVGGAVLCPPPPSIVLPKLVAVRSVEEILVSWGQFSLGSMLKVTVSMRAIGMPNRSRAAAPRKAC